MSLQESLNSYVKSGNIGGFKKPDEDKDQSGSDPLQAYIKTGKLPEKKKIEEKPEEKKEIKYDPASEGVLNLNTDYGVSKSTPTMVDKNSKVVDVVTKAGDVVFEQAGKAIKFGLDAWSKYQEWGDEQRLKSPLGSIQITKLENGERKIEPKYKTVEEMNADIPLVKLMNTKAGQKTISTIADKTSNIPLKVAAGFKAIGDNTYEQAYTAYLKERNNPDNGAFTQFLYELQDSGPQSAIGVLLSLGVSYASRNPNAGYAVSSAYYTALSADEQLKEKGKVDSLGNIAIDVIGDQVLGATLEGLFKDTASKTILKTAGKSFITEGSTETAQSLLKYANDYSNAKGEKEKQAVIDEAKDYVVNGGMAMEFLVGGVSGALIGGGADYIAGKVQGKAGDPGPSLQPTKEGTGEKPKEKTALEMQKEIDKQVANRDFAEIRNELADIQEKIADGGQLDNEEITKATKLADELSDFQTIAKDKAVILRNNEGEKIIDIETVKYDDGKFGFTLDAEVAGQSLSVPFSPVENYNSEQEAVKAAQDFVENWAEENISKEVSEEVKTQLEEFARANEEAKKKGLPTETPGGVKIEYRNKEQKSDSEILEKLKASAYEQKGMYSTKEKKDLYENIVKPKVEELGEVSDDEQIVFYQGDGKKGQYVNTDPREIWHYNVDKNLNVKKIKKADLESTGDKAKDKVGYRKAKNDIDNASGSTYNKEKSYDKQKSDNSGRGDRPGKLPEPVQKSSEKQTSAGGGSAERGESVARGERSERPASAGERSGTRVIQNNEQRKAVAEEATTIVDDGEVILNEDIVLSEEEKLELKNYETAGGREKQGAEGSRLLDEYYTNPEIVNITWKALEGLLPKKLTILEPSVGTGNFLDGVPSKSDVAGLEVNETTARIAKILNPDATIYNKPFENLFLTDRGEKEAFSATYDLVIGNPPYGAHRGKFKGMGEEPGIAKYEEYFIKRSLDLTKEGGYVAMVVPSGFLRGKQDGVKKSIAELGTIEKAYRLPNSSFETTDIGTDIIIIKKNTFDGAKDRIEPRVGMMSNDQYFIDNPENVLGTEFEVKGRFGMETQTKGTLGEAIDKFDKLFPAKEEETGATEEPDEISKPDVEKKLWKESEKEETPEPKVKKPVTKTAQKKQKAILESPKKVKKLVKLSEQTNKDNSDVWKNTTATGELNQEYTRTLLENKPIKQFYNSDVNLTMQDGRAVLYNDFNYFQGDIYKKLDELESIKGEISSEQYKKQKLGLEMAAPQKHTVARMSVSPNTTFARETQITYNTEPKNLASAFESWLDELPYDAFGGSSRWEIIGYIRGESVRGSDKVRNNMIRVRRREMGDKLFKLFLKEGLSVTEQAEVEDKYNRVFNSYARPDYSKVPLVGELHQDFKGKPLDVKPVQLEGVGFLINKGIGLLAHDVGVGKTMQAILSVNEVIQRGWAKRPLIVTPPGNVYAQWKAEIQEIIPNVKIVDLDNLGARFKGDLATLEIPEGAISTISYEGFKRLGFKQETYERLTSDLNDVMKMPGDMTKRAGELAKSKVEEQVGKGIKGTTDQKFFEDLGFDHITFDEVHNSNHIIKGAKLDGNKSTEFRGLTINPSELGIKTWLATQYVLKNNNNRNVFLLSATPFTNHPLEYYSILSLMARERLNRLGLKNVNDFMNMFMDLTYDYEYRADGSYKEKNEIKSFKNYQQFQKLLTEFIDFRDGEEAGVKRPNRISKEYQISPTKDQYDYMQSAQEFFSPKYKDEGGTLIAIGEMRKIAFSPFLSRFYKGEIPNYKTFVEGSPKIKMVAEIIKQNKKDKPEAGQIIYSPIGVEYFPHIKEYLTKVVGYKADEVAIIAGSVAFNKKLAIQEQFNNGDIKVIIGSDSIKEGVNLQKNTTDMFLLSMPWNFTQLRQVIGRAWRQGNKWKNIRVNNIFTENSIDIFLSQKLSNKEKRYENSLAFKGDNLDVGDIDFDELKFDLATDPVIKAQIEYAYKKKALEKQIGEIKADAAFFGRRIQKVSDLQSEIDRYKESVKDNPDDEWYQGALERKQEEMRKEKQLLKERGLDIETMVKELAEKKAPVKTLEKQLNDLEAEYKVKLQEAQNTKEEAIVKENNFSAPVAERKVENKNFYERVDKPVTASAGASVGQYADGTDVMLGSLDNIRPLHLPDMVQMIKDLKVITGSNRRIKSEARATTGKIEYRPEIFENTKQAEKIISHEIGHIVDMLPDNIIDRGNVIGRLFTLRNFLKNTFGELSITNKDIREELWNLSKEWRPLPENYTDGYLKYRKSSRELYADAVSVLFNNPGLLEQKSPDFYQKFIDNLNKKQDVRDSYLSLQQDLVNGMPIGKWRRKVRQGFEEAEMNVKEAQNRIWKERLGEVKEIPDSFRRYFRSINVPVYDMVKEAVANGKKIPDDQNPLYLLSNRGYLPDKINNYLQEKLTPIFLELKENNLTWDDLGELLKYQRILYGDRQNIANPLGLQKDFMEDIIGNEVELTADRLNDRKNEATNENQSMRAELGGARFAILEKLSDQYRSMIKETAVSLIDQGRYSEDVREMIMNNNYYVPFRPKKYADKKMTASMQKQIGTLEDVENPATTGIVKVMALIRGREYNFMTDSVIKLIKEEHPDSIEKAKYISVAGEIQLDTRDFVLKQKRAEGLELVQFFEKGKHVGYFIDKYIAESLQNKTIGANHAVTRMLAMANRLPKTVYITINLAFQIRNLMRDFKRTYKNLASKGYTSFFGYSFANFQSLPMSYRRAIGKYDPEIDKMIKSGEIGEIGKGYILTGDEKTRYENVLANFTGKKGKTNIQRIQRLFEAFTTFTESIPKVAAHKILTKKGVETREKAYIINTFVGTPNYFEQGKLTPMSNVGMLFSNVIIQGWSSDIEVAIDPKTRAGWWWRTATLTLIPKMFVIACLTGWLGDWLKKWYEEKSEYEISNYIIFPLGRLLNGRPIGIKIAEDETSRIIGSTFYKLLTARNNGQPWQDDIRDILSFYGGQLPSVTPVLDVPWEILNYAVINKIPFDDFRQQYVIFPGSNEEKAGGWAAWKKILMYEYGKLGGNILYKPTNKPKTDQGKLEKILDMPIIGNVLSAVITVSNYGKIERYWEMKEQSEKDKAKQSIQEKSIIDKFVDEYRANGKNSIFERNKYELATVKEVIGHLPKNQEEKSKASSIKTRFRLAVKKTVPDQIASVLINSNNKTKIEILRQFKSDSSEEEFATALKSLIDEKIISQAVKAQLK
jgi:hypothetical protein